MKNIISWIGIAALLLWFGCDKKSEDSDSSGESSPTEETDGDAGEDGTEDSGTDSEGTTAGGDGDTSGSDQFTMSGTLAIDSDVSHVYAYSPSDGSTSLVSVEDGSFTVGVKEGQPYSYVLVDDSKSGDEMVVGILKSDTLDGLAAASPPTGTLALGELTMDSGSSLLQGSQKAVSPGISHSELVTGLGLTEEAADTLGKVDDVISRYTNPDIDNDGVIDREQNRNFILDFHNRFTRKKPNGDDITVADLKDSFPGDDTVFSYQGTGIIPELEKELFEAVPDKYSWSFSADVETTSPCAGDAVQDGSLTAATSCELTYEPHPTYPRYQLGIETSNPPGGTYNLKVGEKEFTWTNVAISDLSGGEGFLGLFVRIDTNAEGNIVGASYKYQVKGTDGKWQLADPQVVSLIVKPDSAGISFHIDVWEKEFGLRFPGASAEGTVLLADQDIDIIGDLTEEEVKAGIQFDRIVTDGLGISYDDKLGMRFFF